MYLFAAVRVLCQSMRLKNLMYPENGPVAAVLEAKEERKTKDRNVKLLAQSLNSGIPQDRMSPTFKVMHQVLCLYSRIIF
jgi:hypothetical protein